MRLPLERYLPATGWRWLVQLKPAKIVADPAWQRVFSSIFETRRVEAFASSTGMDPARLTEAWLAGYDLGQLVLLDASEVGAQVEDKALRRARSKQRVQTSFVDLDHHRLVTGDGPGAVLHQREHVVAIAEKDVTLTSIVQAYAEGRLQAPSALQLDHVASLVSFEQEAPVRLFLRGPFPDAEDLFVQGFAEGVLAIHVKGSLLVLRGLARGLWDASIVGEDPRQWVEGLLERPELRALGWSAPVREPKVECQRVERPPSGLPLQECRFEGAWRADAVVQGTRSVAISELSELFPIDEQTRVLLPPSADPSPAADPSTIADPSPAEPDQALD